MTESQLRNLVVTTAKKYFGCKESDGSHRKIIDLYNSHKPLARGYKVTYTDAWCAAYASAISIECGLTDIFPTECGCGEMVNLFKKLGAWQELDSYTPKPADVIFYDWSDNGVGDNKGTPAHVGIVVSVENGIITVIEGNKNNAVEYRTIAVNGKYIRGYGCPNYASKATEADYDVYFDGGKHYASAWSNDGVERKPGKAKITAVAMNGIHQYHLEAVAGGGSDVHGWVDANTIRTEKEKETAETFKLELPVLSKGSKGEAVKAMQILLIGYGYTCGSYGADGDFGGATDIAVCNYQHDNRLAADGICGPATWAKLLGLA